MEYLFDFEPDSIFKICSLILMKFFLLAGYRHFLLLRAEPDHKSSSSSPRGSWLLVPCKMAHSSWTVKHIHQ